MSGPPDHHRRHHHHHLRLSLPSSPPLRFPTPSSSSSLLFPSTPSSASTPSKRRSSSLSSSSASSSSYSSLLLLLLSLRSLYSLLPVLRSSPSPFYPLLPFSFLLSLLSFLLSLLARSLFPAPSPDPLPLSLTTLTKTHLRSLAAKSSLLALSLLLRFGALRFVPAGAAILADLAGSLVANSLSSGHRRGRRILGLAALAAALLLLSFSWDRIGCFPLSSSPTPTEGCVRAAPMLLPFLGGLLGSFERAPASWASLRQLGRWRVRLLSLGLAAAMLLVPAILSVIFAESSSTAVSVGDLGWPLVNTAVFKMLLSENYGGDAKDFRREFAVTFFCTLVLELFYFPKISLPGFLLCGVLLWVAVRELSSSSLNYVELGNADPSESLYTMVVKPVRHILSERKSRKIALFLLINTAYMVVEFVAGFMSNSLGLISDACHMLFDCAALVIGLYASYISRLPANSQFNYGRGRFEVLSGFANAVFLVLVGALIVLESFERILDPQEVSTNSLLAVSVGGLLVNVVGLIFFHDEHHHAHGGGGTCSHSHSHSHSHVDHDHHHNHADENVDPGQEMSSAGHSNGVHSHHCWSHEHHHHHDNQNDEHRNVIDQSHGHEHNHSTHHHEHDHHCHSHEHEQHVHLQQAELHIHENSDKAEGEHKRLDKSSKKSYDHCSEGYTRYDRPSETDGCCQKELPNFFNILNDAHSHAADLNGSPVNGSKEMHRHSHIDHNMEGIFLHVLADTLGSVGVVISTLLIKYKGWLVADPACSIFISLMIVSSVIPLLRNSAEILLQRIPRAHEQDIRLALEDLMKMKGVNGIQNMHVWNLTNTDIVGTLRLHVSAETDKASAMKKASILLHEAGIKDLTIQVECV